MSVGSCRSESKPKLAQSVEAISSSIDEEINRKEMEIEARTRLPGLNRMRNTGRFLSSRNV